MGTRILWKIGEKISRWSHLLEIRKLETIGFVKMSKITVCIYPKTTKTKCNDLFKNFLRRDLNCYHKPSRIRNVDGVSIKLYFSKLSVNCRLNTILQIGEMTFQMRSGPGKRNEQFTWNTAMTIHHTRHGIVSLWKSRTLTRSRPYIVRGASRTSTKMGLFLS